MNILTPARAPLVLLALTLTACGDKPPVAVEQPAAAPVTTPPETAETAPPAPVAPVVPAENLETGLRYAATLAQGIAFDRPGYPEFVRSVSGVSGYEEWGRWTDTTQAPTATFTLREPLSGNVVVNLTLRDYYGTNLGKDATVTLGGQTQNFKVTDEPRQQVRLTFNGVSAADKLNISVPASSKPTATDPRSMGIGLFALSIEQ